MKNNVDILSKFYKNYFNYKKRNKYFNYSFSKKRNNLEGYDIINRENNTFRISSNLTEQKITNNINPYNLYIIQPMFNKLIIKKVNNQSRNNITSKNDNSIEKEKPIFKYIQNINENSINNIKLNKDSQNNTYYYKTSSTFYNTSKNYRINRNTTINTINNFKGKKEIKNNISIPLKNKSINYNKKSINEEADKLFNYYMTTDLSKSRNFLFFQNNTNNSDNKSYKTKKIENEKKKKLLMDTQLLKMKNIRHKLMLGNNHNFKSINIQIKALGREKNRKNMLIGVQDYLMDKKYKSLKDYIENNKQKNKNVDKLADEFEFDDIKSKITFSERIKKKSNLKNRLKKINDSYTLGLFNRQKSELEENKYLNFYKKIELLFKRVKNTNRYIKKRVQDRNEFKSNITNLFILSEKKI